MAYTSPHSSVPEGDGGGREDAVWAEEKRKGRKNTTKGKENIARKQGRGGIKLREEGGKTHPS